MGFWPYFRPYPARSSHGDSCLQHRNDLYLSLNISLHYRRTHHEHGSLHVHTGMPSLWLAPALQLVDFPEASGPKELHYDAEWLAVLRTTHQLMSLQRRPVTLPGARQQCPAPVPHKSGLECRASGAHSCISSFDDFLAFWVATL